MPNKNQCHKQKSNSLASGTNDSDMLLILRLSILGSLELLEDFIMDRLDRVYSGKQLYTFHVLCKICFGVKFMVDYLVEICELPLKYLWSNTLVSVFGDGSVGATDTNRVFGTSMNL
jgi:hypothetical protein